MTLPIAVIHEADADFRIATELADRALVVAIDWLDPDLVVHQRTWIAESPVGRRLTWAAIPDLAFEARIRAHGHFGGEPGLPDASAARKAILYLQTVFDDLKGIVFIRDQDDQPERRDGLNQARNSDHSGLPIVIGFAVVMREAWVISGFDPLDEAEQTRLDAVRTRVGFDPRERSHELHACKDDGAPRSPKRALRELSDDDRDRERQCWTARPLDLLRGRGRHNGLADYLDEVRDRLAPLLA